LPYLTHASLPLQNDEFLRLTMNAIHNDLSSRNEAFETLALSFIGNGAMISDQNVIHSSALCSCSTSQAVLCSQLVEWRWQKL
jgi:hypothetical protein